MNPQGTLPLSDLRVIDLTDGVAGVAGRVLADMGADVILVEPPGGAATRRQPPLHRGHGLRFATTHSNKRGVVIDLDSAQGPDRLLGLIDGADLVLESYPPGYLERRGVGPDTMRERHPGVVVTSVTDFGQTGPYRDYTANDAVLTAMSSALTRSGAPGREPLLPPGELASQTAAVHVAFAALLAVYHARRTGRGDYVDCSLFDLAVQDLDPALGMGGTATMGQPLTELPPGRPDRRMLYPVLPCADGHVRMFIGSAKQWRAVFTWLGEPESLSDPSLEQFFTRFLNWDKIRPALVELFADKSRDEIVTYASEQGVAVAPLSTPAEILRSDHVEQRRSFRTAEVAPGLVGAIANGFVEFDRQRAGFRHRAPEPGEHDHLLQAETRSRRAVEPARPARRPLEGVRVLDLGVIVVGAETGRSLADQGADVIKIETREFMDGARQSDGPDRCGYSFALGNRGKRSFGLNLRAKAGKEVFRQLVAKSDVVLTNFKPGTLESLGLSYQELRSVNPRIIVVESSAWGASGPWSKRMGYGPLVRSTIGLTQLWRHPGASDEFGDDQFGDDMTVYPDHAAGRAGSTAVMAALLERERTGVGRRIELAQMDTVFGQLVTEFLRESLEPGSLVASGNCAEFDAPSGLYRCSGEDAYCAVAVDGDDEFERLAAATDRLDLATDPRYRTAADRVAHRDQLDEALGAWMAGLIPVQAQDRLQAAGVAAGAAVHASELPDNPQLNARRQFGSLPQPGYDEPLQAEMGPALFENIPEPELRPASLMAADTVEVCRDILGMSDAEVDKLVAAGVLEVREAATVTSR
ncbi:CaiB/BaiF CoA transferase family protein [Mycolicibacterium stellerae]|uniref:CaiB/BaiF CoA transferase family protein n=1 Tax=Mycolicibacterium stellerae TaxID=2358193 RepID=UPI0013DDB022|nr:CoA transferase [Mycolicibacterium stellerae]